MRKPLAVLCPVLAMLAVALLPSAASAANDPQLTYPTGTLISLFPEHPKISATDVGIGSFTDSSGTTLSQCFPFLTGSLDKNSGSAFEIGVTTASLGCSGWTVITSAPWCLKSTSLMAEDAFQLSGTACTNPVRGPTLVINNGKYERSAPMAGTFKTDSSNEDAFLSLTHVEFIREFGQVCATPTTIFFNATLTLETDTSTTADPIYIS
jgi:hypothetical protein